MIGARQLGIPGVGDLSGAILSGDQLYRYRLWRRWGRGNHALFVMLNPSTADARVDDPTIRKCIGFARLWQCDAIEVVNLFAYRSTDPVLLAQVGDPVGPDNDAHLAEAARTAELVVVAWGCRPSKLQDALFRLRIKQARAALGDRAMCLGRTKTGEPRHPLMLSYETRLIPA